MKTPVKRTRHGETGRSEHGSWNTMIQRCYNPSNTNYRYYGAVGIKVCERWLSGYLNFLKDMGRKPAKNYTLERIDRHGDYTPGNCRWATMREQSRNKRNNRLLTINGITKLVVEWREEAGISKSLLNNRLRYGWTGTRLLQPPRQRLMKANNQLQKGA